MATQNASLQPIYDRLHGAAGYHPMSAETFADWSVEAGDIISVSRDGTAYSSPVHNSKLVWRGTPQVTINSTGQETRDTIARISRRKYGRGGYGMWNDQSIHYDLYSEDGRLRSQLDLTASHLQLEFQTDITSTVALFHSELEMTSSHLTLEFQTGITSTISLLESELEMTSSHLQTEFTNNILSLHSELELTASHLQTEFEDGINSVHSEVVQTASSWNARVAGVVDEQGNVTAASIAVAINASSGESEAKIDAQRVYIGNDKSTTVIAGKAELSDVTADYINAKIGEILMLNGLAAKFSGNLISESIVFGNAFMLGNSAPYINISNPIMAVQVAGPTNDVYTLQYKAATDTTWQDAGNFSRATALDGAWNSGTLTVTASPQGKTFVRTIVQDSSSAEWTATSVNVPIRAQWSSGGSTYSESTGQSVYVDFYSRLQSKRVTTNGTVTPDEGMIGLSSVEVDVSAPSTPIIDNTWSNGLLTVTTTPPAQNDLVRQLQQSGRSVVGKTISIPVVATYGSQQQYSENTGLVVTTDTTDLLMRNIEITENGTYAPSSRYIGFDTFSVNVGGGSSTPVISSAWVDNVLSIATTPAAEANLTVSITNGSATWSGYTASVPVVALNTYAGGSTTSTTVRTVTVDASSIASTAEAAGRASVHIKKEWGTGIDGNKAIFSKSTGDYPDSQILTISATAGISYNSTSHTYTATAGALGDGIARDTDSIQGGLEAWYAGKASVTLGAPVWTTTPSSSVTSNSNTVTISTVDRTNTSGTTDNLGQPVSLYMTQDSTWASNNRKYVYVNHTNSSDSNRVARVQVDAADIYTKGQNGTYVTSPTWATTPSESITVGSNTATFTTNAPNPAQAASRALNLYITQDEDWDSMNRKYVYINHTSQSATNRIARMAVYASNSGIENNVRVLPPTWATSPSSSISADRNTATFTTDAQSPAAGTSQSLDLFLIQDNWDSNNQKKIYVCHTYTHPDNKIAQIQIQASDIGNNVHVTGPTWATAPSASISVNTNTATFTTDAPSPSSGTPKSLALYMSQDSSWSSNTKYVYVSHTSSSSANRISRLQVDASSIYTNGRNATKVSGPTWTTTPSASVSGNSNTATFTTDAPSPVSGAAKSLSLYMSQDSSWSSNKKYVYVSHTNSSSANRIARIQVDASGLVPEGNWAEAYAKVSLPGSNQSTSSCTVKTPAATKSSNPNQNTDVFSLVVANNTADIMRSQNSGTAITVARITHNKYTAGRNDTKVSGPTWATTPSASVSGNSNTASFTTDAPSPVSGAAKSLSLYMSQDPWSNGKKYVYVTHTNSSDANRIARLEVTAPASTPGEVDLYPDGASDISVTNTLPSGSTNLSTLAQRINGSVGQRVYVNFWAAVKLNGEHYSWKQYSLAIN